MSGKDSASKWYPPLATDLSSIITDLLATTVDNKVPNDIYGDVYYTNFRETGSSHDITPSFGVYPSGNNYKMGGNILSLYNDWY